MQKTLPRKPRAAIKDVRKSAPDWGAAGWAGLAAAVAFMMVELALRPFFGAWIPSRLVASAVLGPLVLAPPPQYAPVIHAAAIGVHLTLSLIYARLLALLMHRWRMSRALEAGAAFGLALYLLNFYALAAAFPDLAQARGWITVASHVAFGVTAALLYKKLERPAETRG